MTSLGGSSQAYSPRYGELREIAVMRATFLSLVPLLCLQACSTDGKLDVGRNDDVTDAGALVSGSLQDRPFQGRSMLWRREAGSAGKDEVAVYVWEASSPCPSETEGRSLRLGFPGSVISPGKYASAQLANATGAMEVATSIATPDEAFFADQRGTITIASVEDGIVEGRLEVESVPDQFWNLSGRFRAVDGTSCPPDFSANFSPRD